MAVGKTDSSPETARSHSVGVHVIRCTTVVVTMVVVVLVMMMTMYCQDQ